MKENNKQIILFKHILPLRSIYIEKKKNKASINIIICLNNEAENIPNKYKQIYPIFNPSKNRILQKCKIRNKTIKFLYHASCGIVTIIIVT